MQIHYEFPTPIGICELKNIDKISIIEKIYSLIEINDDIALSFTTNDHLHTESCFQNLVLSIDLEVKHFAEDTLGIEPSDIELSGMWSNVQNNGSSHPMHQHPNSFISGVFYLQVPEDFEKGKIVFDDPRISKNMQYADFKKNSCISNRCIWIEPKEDILLLFPSWLVHGTQPFLTKGNNKRISISFNYKLINCNYETMKI